ncbi:MAG: ABC transporter ATP-binding protein [Anaerolineales bacterium]|nr:ABC transporter ATP-binding protein [Anaerolineales bacterium]
MIPMMKPVVQTADLEKRYGDAANPIRALAGVSLTVEPGEFVAVVGPSGSGKTTLLSTLATLLTPTSGAIHIAGEDLGSLSEAERTVFRRRKIGFTFQANNLVPYLTARENVELMLRLNGILNKETRSMAGALLDRLGLGDRLNSYPNQLSGGQQQRVAIARALVHSPELVLADEPTASLDTERAHQVVETFASLIHEQGRAGIMVTHDLRMVRYVDRMVRMEDGRVASVISDPAAIQALADGTPAPVAIPASVEVVSA